MSSSKLLLQEAVIHHSAGRLAQAEQIYTKILKNEPDSGDANNLFGALMHQLGRSETAIQLIQKAIKKHPDRSSYQINLAVVYEGNGELEKAVDIYQEILRINSSDPSVFFNLGNVYCKLGKLDKACDAYRNTIRIDPHFDTVYFNLGNTFSTLEKYPEAIQAYEKALQHTPGNPDILCNLGCAYRKFGQSSEAVQSFDQALKTAPNHLNSLYNLGEVFFRSGKIDDAIKLYRQVLDINSDFVKAWIGLATVYEAGSDYNSAEGCVQKALATEPGNPDALRISAVLLRRQSKYDEAIDVLNKINIPADDMDSAMRIHFELGLNYDRIGNADKAFAHFTEGNNIQAQLRSYGYINKNRYLKTVDSMRKKFNGSFASALSNIDLPQHPNMPIFLVGFPRSGTTLTHMILDSHPGLQVMDEVPALHRVASHLRGNSTDYLDALTGMTEEKQAQIQALYFQIIDESITREPGKILIDKLPLNILYVPLIHTIFPGAKIVLIIRHPYDVCLSNFMQMYELSDAMANFSTLEDAAILYDKIILLWKKFTEHLNPDYHTLRYENIIDNPEEEIKKLIRFLGQDWDDNVLQFHKHAREKKYISTPSYHQVTQPLYQDAVYRWKSYRKYFIEFKHLLTPHVNYFQFPGPTS